MLKIRNTGHKPGTGSLSAGVMLFLYAITFSFAYITLNTGTGALILFGSVQITMILLSILSGNKLHVTEWIGVLIAFAGFVYLVLPGVAAPSLTGFILMTVAGIAWGVYTLKGRHSADPLLDTAYNFIRTVPFSVLLVIIALRHNSFTIEGILLAVLSGGIASGIGYMIWYIALRGISDTQAAVVQLSVPIIAAIGGIIFMSEAITLRLTMSAVAILGGILLVFTGRHYFVRPNR
jgi:drug/metabolite transporter (DMT)-like permease